MSNYPPQYPENIFPDNKIPLQVEMAACAAVRCMHVVRGRFSGAKIVSTEYGEPVVSYIMVPHDQLEPKVASSMEMYDDHRDEGSVERYPLTAEEALYVHAGKLAILDVLLAHIGDTQAG